MAKKLHPTPPREAALDSTIVIGFVVCALLAAGFAYWRLQQAEEITEASFQFAELQVDHQMLDKQRQEKYGNVNLQTVQAEWQELMAVARNFNRAQFEGISQLDRSKMAVQLGFLANEIIPATGFDGFVVSGEPLFHQCEQGLDELLAAVQSGELSMEQARENPPADRFSAYRDNCGNFLPLLVDRGLVSQDGQWTFDDAPIIVDLLNRYRWAHVIQDQRKPRAQLTGYGLRLFERWRVEHATDVSEANREKHLERLARHDPDYNAEYARGVIAFQSGDLDKALEHFDKLARAYPTSDYPRYAAYLRERLESGANEVVAEGEKTY